MSNLRQGQTIYSNEKDFKLIHHDDDHVVAWNHNYADGQATNTWRSVDAGTPEQAVRCFPGLQDEILAVRK